MNKFTQSVPRLPLAKATADKMQNNPMSKFIAMLAIMIFVVSSVLSQEEGYKRIHTAGEGMLFNLGPTGIWGYGPHALKGDKDTNFFMVQRAEVGSPAFGKIEKHDVITGSNGKAFPKGEDPRAYLAYAIVDSEAKDGKLALQITRGGTPMTVTLQLEEIPDYSPIWPFDCKRSTAVLNRACDFLAGEQMPEGDVPSEKDGYIGPIHAGLLWLASGEPRYMQNACRAAYWYKEQVETGKTGWMWAKAYGGVLLAEYYLMTGDKGILPGVENLAGIIAKGQMPSGGWSHGGYSGISAGYGEVNNVGMVCYMALVLAKECGVKVDEAAIKRAEKYYDKFAPSLSSAYGDHYMGFDKYDYDSQNGKVGGQAIAHLLNNRLQDSANYALKASRAVDSIESGHTGHYFNMMWTPIAASTAPAKEYRRTMDQIGWYLTLSRTWRGGLFCAPTGGGKYSEGGANMTTGGYGLILAVGRRHLRILGAPKGVFGQKLTAELTAARDLHQSRKWDESIAAVDAFLKKGGLDKETLRLANELRDKSRYMKAGVEQAYLKLEELVAGGRLMCRPFKCTGIIKHMRMLLGEDDARLKAIEAKLPEKFREIWRHDQRYHEVFRTITELNTANWFIFASLLSKDYKDAVMPADSPKWTLLAQVSPKKKTEWKTSVVKPPQKEPAGWAGVDFDASGWQGPDVRLKKAPEDALWLIRVPFDLKQASAKQLRVEGGLAAGGKVYLNGVCVLETVSGSSKGKIQLMDKACRLLRKGKNVFAYSTTMPQNAKGLPSLLLEAEMNQTEEVFQWTVDPERDAGIRKLVAERRTPQPYYQAGKDARTVNELMAVLNADPFFMPEAANAIIRFIKIVPELKDRAAHVQALLKSSNWGARWTGAFMVCHAMTQNLGKTPSDEDKERERARVAAGGVWAKQFTPLIVKLLDDPHQQVRLQATEGIKLFGSSAQEAIPALIRLQGDVEGQSWFIRATAFDALRAMPIEAVAMQAVTRTGLKDPISSVRGGVLNTTFYSKDAEVIKKATQTYKEELINQVFDAPHGMATKFTRGEMAKVAIANLTKDELRPYLPRFFSSLRWPSGSELQGCMAVLVSFGEEVRPKLETLTKDKDPNICFNAIDTLLQIAGQKPSPEAKELLLRQITAVMPKLDAPRAHTARSWVINLGGKDALVAETENKVGDAEGSNPPDSGISTNQEE